MASIVRHVTNKCCRFQTIHLEFFRFTFKQHAKKNSAEKKWFSILAESSFEMPQKSEAFNTDYYHFDFDISLNCKTIALDLGVS